MTVNERGCDDGLLLAGLDGANPLAFLAALGTLRTLAHAWPDGQVKMNWTDHGGAWRPVLWSIDHLTEERCTDLLYKQLVQMREHPALGFADDLSVSPEEFRNFALQGFMAANATPLAGSRIAADFAAAFACDALVNDQGTVQDTALRTMSGAGHQHFLAFMRHIVINTTPEHLHKTLFTMWRYDDPAANQTLRWDPADDSRYALRWRDPSGDPARKKGGTMLGANRLAIEALPLVTSAPVGNMLCTTGFTGRGSRDTFWTWPIWTRPVCLDVCRSLLTLPMLLRDDAQVHRQLQAMGIATAFRSQRITTGKFRNFTPAVAVF